MVTCDLGYELEGKNAISCNSNGDWTVDTLTKCNCMYFFFEPFNLKRLRIVF